MKIKMLVLIIKMPGGDRPKRNQLKPEPKIEKKKKVARQLVPISASAPITSANIPVGGEQGVSKNNKLDTLIYEYGADGWAYARSFGDRSYEDLIWYFYKDPYTTPGQNGTFPTVEDIDPERYTIILKPQQQFTDLSKHDVLGVRVPTATKKGFTEYKIKFAPSSENSGFPYFYIEEYQGPGLPMRKKWGDIGNKVAPEENNFGKAKKSKKTKNISIKMINQFINYLKLI